MSTGPLGPPAGQTQNYAATPHSTNPPYSGFSASSTSPMLGAFYAKPTAAPASIDSSRLGVIEVGLAVVGILIAGLVGYFFTLMDVKADIAENRENISVLRVSLERLGKDVSDAEEKGQAVDKISESLAVIKMRVAYLERRADRLDDRSDERGKSGNGGDSKIKVFSE